MPVYEKHLLQRSTTGGTPSIDQRNPSILFVHRVSLFFFPFSFHFISLSMQKKSHKQQPEEAFVLSSKCFFPVMETRRRIVNFHFYEESCFLNDNTFTLFVVSLCIVYTYIYRIYIGDRIVRSNLYRNGFHPSHESPFDSY